MAVIGLSIDEPGNDQIFTGTASVTFRGSATVPAELTGIPVYYRWYSNQFSSGVDDRYSMNEPAQNSANEAYVTTLVPGTHSIAFAASDVAGEGKTDFESIQHAGVTGGAKGDSKCLIHVFRANILMPVSGATLGHAAVVLQAEAPPQWAVSADAEVGGPPYVPNDDYHEINRLQYRWRFTPNGSPSNRPVVEYIPIPEDLDYQPKDDAVPATDPTRVEFTAALPATAIGSYHLTLYAEDKHSEATDSHSQQITVTLT